MNKETTRLLIDSLENNPKWSFSKYTARLEGIEIWHANGCEWLEIRFCDKGNFYKIGGFQLLGWLVPWRRKINNIIKSKIENMKDKTSPKIVLKELLERNK